MARYHHGNLRDAILSAAAESIARSGIDGFSLRGIATGIGVSHTAFRRHFGSREGVFNALAIQGFERLADALGVAAADGAFIDVGVAYVRFALAHRGHFTVMFRADLLDHRDPELNAARKRAFAPLAAGVAALDPADAEGAEMTGWAVVHGIATLALTGNLPRRTDVPDLTRRALAHTYRRDTDA